MMYDYITDWCDLAYPEMDRISTSSDIESEFTSIDLNSVHLEASGIPLLVKQGKATVNNDTENTIIFGETGSKKTRCVIAPLITLIAGAGESAFITDVKGELSTNAKLQRYLKDKDVHTVFLDFRNFAGDGYNILDQAFKLYLKGERDKAISNVSRFLNALNERYKDSRDHFWDLSAIQYLLPLTELMFAVCASQKGRHKYMNMLTISGFANDNAVELLKQLVGKLQPTGDSSDNTLNMLRSVLTNPEKTLACILTTVQSIIQDFTLEANLMNMLSQTTFDIESMYRKPTLVFLIIPDETSTYDSIAGLLIDSFYNTLIEQYSNKYQNKHDPPCRINFICDEFCNLKINDMKAKISASRSRSIRWFLVCQSKNQLETVYPDSSGTIIGNCKNTLFLQSSDPDLLSYISSLCGETEVTSSGGSAPLVTVQMLKKLRKEKSFKEALFIRGNTKYFSELPDFDSYKFIKKYKGGKAFVIPNKCINKAHGYIPSLMIEDIIADIANAQCNNYK